MNWLTWDIFLLRMLLKEGSDFTEAGVDVFLGHVFHPDILRHF